MADMNVDEGLDKLNDVLGTFGFRKALDRAVSSRELRQLHGMRYADRNGNVIDVSFALRVAKQGSGIMIEVSFNKNRTRAWPSFDALVAGLPVTVNEWLEDDSHQQDAADQPPTVIVPTGPRGKTRISFKSILTDIKSGVSDGELMEKFGLSHRGLLSLISKLLWDGLLTQEELAKRKSLARTVFMPVLRCRLCKEIQFEKVTQCPKCGGPMKVVNKRDADDD
jgi:hypothetical protein